MDRGTLRERASELLPAIAERAPLTEQQRHVPEETIKELHEADLFRALQPARFNGLECDPGEFFEAIVDIGEVCGSTAWVLGVLSVHSWQLGLFPEQAQLDVWGEDETTLVSSSYAPTGTVEPVEGGFVLRGTWLFSSGCDATRWAMLGGLVPRPDDAPPPPDLRTFLVPDTDYEVLDNWHVAGMSGSGSKGLVLDGAFVPEYRTHRFTDVLSLDSPGNAVNASPLFRLPFGGIFCSAVAAPALGVARGVLRQYTEQCKTRVMADRTRAVEDPFSQVRLAEVAAALDGIELQMKANFAEMSADARAGRTPTLERRARYRWDASRMVRVATECVDSLFEASGGKALALDNPMQRAFRDVHGMRAHANNNWEKSAQIFARAVLGFPNKEFLL